MLKADFIEVLLQKISLYSFDCAAWSSLATEYPHVAIMLIEA